MSIRERVDSGARRLALALLSHYEGGMKAALPVAWGAECVKAVLTYADM